MAIEYQPIESPIDGCRAQILALWSANLMGSSDAAAAKLDAGYLNNPAGKGGVVALRVEPRQEIVGVIGLHPRRFFKNEVPVAAASLADYAVDSAHRSVRPALTLMRAALARGLRRYAFVYGIPNRSAAGVCSRAGMTRVGSLALYTKLISTLPRLRKRSKLPQSVVPLLARVMDTGIRLADGACAMLLRPRMKLREAAFDEPSIDAVWARRPRDFLLSERTTLYMNWRFGSTAGAPWRVCVAEDSAGSALGFVVWRLVEGVATIGDFLCIDPARQVAAMLHAFARFAAARGAEATTLAFFGNVAVAGQFRRAGYFRLRHADPLFAASLDAAEAPRLAGWYITDFDNDNR